MISAQRRALSSYNKSTKKTETNKTIKTQQIYELLIVEKGNCKPSGRETAHFQYELNVNVSYV